MSEVRPKTAGLQFSVPTVLNLLAVFVIVLAVTILIGRPGYDQLRLRYYLSRYSNPSSNSTGTPTRSFVYTTDGPLALRWPTFESMDSLSIFLPPQQHVEFVFTQPADPQYGVSEMIRDYPFSDQSVSVCILLVPGVKYSIEDFNAVFHWPHLIHFGMTQGSADYIGSKGENWASTPRRIKYIKNVVEEWYQAHQDAGGQLSQSDSDKYLRRIGRMMKRHHYWECCAGPVEDMYE